MSVARARSPNPGHCGAPCQAAQARTQQEIASLRESGVVTTRLQQQTKSKGTGGRKSRRRRKRRRTKRVKRRKTKTRRRRRRRSRKR